MAERPDSGPSVDIPETHYAKAPDGAYVAYQVLGEGPDLLYVPDAWSGSSVSWDQPHDARFLRALASFSRLIVLDRRGTGRSDPVTDHRAIPLEVQVADVSAVLDAVGSTSAAVFGVFEGGPLCMLFAASQPDRTAALILYATYARGAWAPDYPWAWTDEEFEADIERIEATFLSDAAGKQYVQEWIEEFVPSLSNDESARPWLTKYFEMTHGPGASLARFRMEHELDVRAVLPTIRAPTLVLNRRGDRIADLPEGRWLAKQIPGASFKELEGDDHPPWAGDQGDILDAISGFLGVKRRSVVADRVLATVLFTDIVGSTGLLAARGDAGWTELLARHDEIARDEIERHRGRYVESTGDGLLATLDGPAMAIRCAQAIGERVRSLGIEIRAGVHTGEVELAGQHVRGIAVHIGARVAALAGPNDVLVSSTVRDLAAGSGLVFADAGEHELKGIPDTWRLYRVVEKPM